MPVTVQPTPDNVTPLALFTVRLLKVVAALPPMVCAPVPLNVVIADEVNAAELTLFVKLPPKFTALPPVAQLPDERVTFPATVHAALWVIVF